MVEASPYLLENLSGQGEVMGTSIKIRVVSGTHARFLGEFEMVDEALEECKPENILSFLLEHNGPLREVREQGITLCGIYYSPEELEDEIT